MPDHLFGSTPAQTSESGGAPFVRLRTSVGLHGVTKLEWRTWPSRSWLSWVLAAVFLATAFLVISLTSALTAAEPGWQRILRWVVTGALAAVVITRLILEGTVSKPAPGAPPQWDKQFVDPWWTSIHTTTGFVLGLWLTPFLVVAALTVLWECLEISVPGFGDEEINGNRLVDIGVAWTGWLIAAGLAAGVSYQPVPWF